ncbi:DUF3560 domain-containing protein, partial [Xanthomonas citri pv. citri]|nr:DUF3560 domain-containing protein [Xanthomonas citri pv. citri]
MCESNSNQIDHTEEKTPMNSYEAKLEARRERLLTRAQEANKNADSLHKKARSMAGAIPFGQPILVGHHSESR